MSAEDYNELLTHVATARNPEDCNTPDELGKVSLFGGHMLTADEVDAFADFLRRQADIARRALYETQQPGPTQAEWEQGWIDAVAKGKP
jgi:hypothetical protein